MTSTTPNPAILTGLRNPANAYMAATGASMAGSALGMLGATAATTVASRNGGLATGLFVSVTFLASALAVPYAPRVAHRLHVRRTFAAAKALSAVAWIAAGVALLFGAPPLATLIVAAPAFGISAGVAAIVSPTLGKAYLRAAHTAHSAARMAVVGGVAWAAGALAGGALLNHVVFGWGVLLNGILTGVLVVTVTRIAPPTEPHAQRAVDHPWRSVIGVLRSDRVVALTSIQVVLTMLFIAPLVSLTVPIADGLRDESLVILGSLLMAAIGTGNLLAPWVVHRETARHPALSGAARTAVAAGGTMVVLGVVSLVLTRRIELATWVVIGIAFGAFRFASRALAKGSAAEGGEPGHASANLAAVGLVGSLAAPFGTMLWGALIDGVSAEAALLVGATGGILGSLAVLAAARTTTPAEPATP